MFYTSKATISVYLKEEPNMKHLTTAVLLTALTATGLGVMTPVLAEQHGRHGMGMMQQGGGWKATLSEKQQIQVSNLKLDYKKKKYPLKTKIKQIKVELPLLITTKKPNQKTIKNKIDQIVKLKAKKIRLRANHKIAVRKVINEQQRVKFDMKILKKDYHGKKKGHYGHH